MRAGKPVYVEKPMARSYSECLEMLQVSSEKNVPLWVAYYRRTLPAFLKIKELIGLDTIGKPLMINVKLHKQADERDKTHEEMHWHVFPEIAGAGHFFDLASHQFDYFDFVFGPVTNVKGIAINQAGLYPAEDTVSGTWKHESGVVGTGSWCFVVDESSEKDEIIITGDKGEIMFSCFALGPVKIKTSNSETEMEFKNPAHISQNLVQQVVDELRGIGECVSTGVSAARTSWVLDEMVKEYYSRK
jgi:predicted dehydrogenase